MQNIVTSSTGQKILRFQVGEYQMKRNNVTRPYSIIQIDHAKLGELVHNTVYPYEKNIRAGAEIITFREMSSLFGLSDNIMKKYNRVTKDEKLFLNPHTETLSILSPIDVKMLPSLYKVGVYDTFTYNIIGNFPAVVSGIINRYLDYLVQLLEDKKYCLESFYTSDVRSPHPPGPIGSTDAPNPSALQLISIKHLNRKEWNSYQEELENTRKKIDEIHQSVTNLNSRINIEIGGVEGLKSAYG